MRHSPSEWGFRREFSSPFLFAAGRSVVPATPTIRTQQDDRDQGLEPAKQHGRCQDDAVTVSKLGKTGGKFGCDGKKRPRIRERRGCCEKRQPKIHARRGQEQEEGDEA